jgi:hypothetical protein
MRDGLALRGRTLLFLRFMDVEFLIITRFTHSLPGSESSLPVFLQGRMKAGGRASGGERGLERGQRRGIGQLARPRSQLPQLA